MTGLLSSSGAIIANYYYDAFGNITEQTGNFSNPYRYAGYIFDEESHLDNLNARFYDATIARFMQEYAYLGNNRDPLSLNLYTYCHNNPLIYYDPTGNFSILSMVLGIAIGAAVGAAVGNATGETNSAAVGAAVGTAVGALVGAVSGGNSISSGGSSDGSGSSSGGSGSGGSSGNSSSYKLSDFDYQYFAAQLGLSTYNSPYKDIIDTMLGIGGFTSFTGVSIANGAATMDYSQKIAVGSLAFSQMVYLAAFLR